MARVPRLFIDHDLARGGTLPLSREASNYLFGVMRLREGAQVEVFNGRDGAWLSRVADAGKRGGTLICETQSGPQTVAPDVWLLFAPLKKAQTDFVVQKAVEMGVSKLMPVQTQFTNSDRIRRDRMLSHVIEAAEQCGISHVPEVDDLQPLPRVLDTWSKDRHLLFCDETLAGQTASDLSVLTPAPWAILIGPEGGFSTQEAARLRGMACAVPTGLGPRILRAETAAVAALAMWQSQIGDWR